MTLFDTEEAMRKGDEAMNAGLGTLGAAPRLSSTRCLSTPSTPLGGLEGFGRPQAVLRLRAFRHLSVGLLDVSEPTVPARLGGHSRTLAQVTALVLGSYARSSSMARATPSGVKFHVFPFVST